MQIASSLSARFGLDEAADDRKKLVDRFTGGRSNEPLDVAVKNYRRARAENEADAARHDVANLQHLVASILVPMHDMAFVDEPHAIIWPAECFYLADEPDAKKMASSNAFIELTGPSRMLLHGPYLHLPAARYRAAITLDVRDFAKDCIFRVDVSCGATELGKFRLVPRKPGRSIAEFEFEVVDPIPEIQAQLVAERGAIFGQVKLERLTLTPVTAASLKPRTAPQPGDIMQACER
ncbi:MAG: hypothetical protein KJ587_18525 [Alphaproteobacteria bacterium]|nr:hypothetical protein [Alphaproteobacteria bacterium]